MNGWLEGYSTLITGGGSGIGRAVAERFLAEGAHVAVFDRDKAKLDGFPSDGVHTVTGDVRDPAALQRAVAETVERFGKLDTLVANAGVWDYQRQLTRLSAEQIDSGFDELFSINVKGNCLPRTPRGPNSCARVAAS